MVYPPRDATQRADVRWIVIDQKRRDKLARWLLSQKPEFGRRPSMNQAMSKALAEWVDSLEMQP